MVQVERCQDVVQGVGHQAMVQAQQHTDTHVPQAHTGNQLVRPFSAPNGVGNSRSIVHGDIVPIAIIYCKNYFVNNVSKEVG